MKKSINMPKKIVSIFMALLFISISVPFAFAAEPIVLSESNITVWPSANGEIFFGQKISDGVTLSGGTVTTDGTDTGTVIPGKFEFVNPDEEPTSSSTAFRATIKFVPEDETAYTGFEVSRTKNVTFPVNKTTPVLVDESNLPIATKVEAGAKLSTSVLSGGQIKNPYKPDEPKALAGVWKWTNGSTVVTESGYYEARITVSNYERLYQMVYVGINGDIVETTVSETPTIPELTYDGTTKWRDLTLTGGVAVEKDTTNVVEGTFSITDSKKNQVIEVGTHEIVVTFTPNDTEAYSKAECKISVTVNKAPIRFVDENGNDIVPEITVPYGTKFSYVEQLLKPYIKGAEYTALIMGDLEYKSCEEDGTYTISAYAPSDGDHYEKTELTFKIIIEKKKINPKLYSEPGKLYIEDTSGIYNPTGTFTLIYYIGGEKQGSIEGIKYLERFDWNPTKSGNYEYEIVYVEATENEHYIIDAFKANNALTLSWAFKATGAAEGTTYQYGSEVALEAPATDPAKEDKPFYGFVKWEDANGNTGLTEEELSNREISFTMPDGEVELNATYKFDFCLCIRYYIQIVVDWFNSFFQSIGTLF